MTKLNKIKYAHYAYLPDSGVLNEEIVKGFDQFKDDPLINKTHFFAGRYENVYIERESIPELKKIIEHAINLAAEVLELDVEKIQCGFWFNSMQAGDVTQPHTHDDDDELLSAVYYIEVPENSGQLLLGISSNQVAVEPEAGKIVFFSPRLIHEVTENLSDHHRLSIGLNFGFKKEFKEE